MAPKSGEIVDPRVLRTRNLLVQALGNLLKTQDFDQISVQDITEAATVNRATFYDHYSDKFSLLNCMVASQFNQLLGQRNVQFDGTCSSALKSIVLAVCDYLTQIRQLEPLMESAIIAVLRRMILDGLQAHPAGNAVAPEIVAATVSWAIYGAAKEWVQTPDRCPSDEIAGTIVQLVAPVMQALQHAKPAATP